MDTKTEQTPKRLTEADLLAKGHTHIVAGTLRYDLGVNKQKVTINTIGADGEFDGNTREIATSDLHQCRHTETVKESLDKAKRNAKAKAKRAKAKASQPVAVEALEETEASDETAADRMAAALAE